MAAVEPKKQRRGVDDAKERLSAVFTTFDTDGSGGISREELGEALRSLDFSCTEEALSKFMNGCTHLGQCSRPTPPVCGAASSPQCAVG